MSEELKPCPFCGAGETRIDEARQWQGMGYSEPISVSVRHWCVDTPGQPKRMIERIGRDRASAIAAWNRRTVSGQMTNEQKAALDLAVLNLKTHGDDQLLSAVQPLIDFYEARRTVSGQEAVLTMQIINGEVFEYEYTGNLMDGEYRLYAAPIPATEPKEPK